MPETSDEIKSDMGVMGLDKNKSEETEGNFSEAIDVEGEKRGENEGGLCESEDEEKGK